MLPSLSILFEAARLVAAATTAQRPGDGMPGLQRIFPAGSPTGRPTLSVLLRTGFTLLLLSVFAAVPLYGQAPAGPTFSLSGQVHDAETTEPLAGVNVFLAGTTIGTTTNSEGQFQLSAIPSGGYTLVAKMMGYDAHAAPLNLEPGETLKPLRIRLSPTTFQLDGVTVSAERSDTWKERLALFKDQFLGTSEFAGDTELLNPYVLGFEAGPEDRLTARALAPLKIINRALGYQITFVLLGFEYDRRDRWNPSVTFDGYAYFEPLTADSQKQYERWRANRRKAFRGSRRHLLWAMTHDRVREESFSLSRDEDPGRESKAPAWHRPVETREILERSDTSNLYELSFDDYLRVEYDNGSVYNPLIFWREQEPPREVTWWELAAGAAYVHQSGYLYPPVPVVLHGPMGERRVAQLLPHEYARTEWQGENQKRIPLAAHELSFGSHRESTPGNCEPNVRRAVRQYGAAPDSAELAFTFFRRVRGCLGDLWVIEDRSAATQFLRAEKLRMAGHWAQADSIYALLLAGDNRLPHAPLLLARARLAAAQDKPQALQRYVGTAMGQMDGPLEAALVFEDLKYIVSEDELEAYRTIGWPAGYRRFAYGIWARRDPLPGSKLNRRLVEHYHRLVAAEEHHLCPQPDHQAHAQHAGDLTFPATYGLNHAFSDRGLVYLRHGAPDDRMIATSESGHVRHSWGYAGEKLIFHFRRDERDVWTLAKGREIHPTLLKERSFASFVRENASSREDVRAEGTARETGMQLGRLGASQRWIDRGLTSDSYTGKTAADSASLFVTAASSPGKGGRSRVNVYYAVPGSERPVARSGADSLGVVAGIAIHDEFWQPVLRKERKASVALHSVDSAGIVGHFPVSLPPGKYNVALHVRIPSQHLMGTTRQEVTVSDFEGQRLTLSDPLLTYGQTSAPDLEGEPLPASPTNVNVPAAYHVGDRLGVYVTAYSQAFGAEHPYDITYELRPKGHPRSFFRRLLGLQSAVQHARSIRRRSSTRITPVHTTINLSGLRPGEYRLTVYLTDEETGQTVKRTRVLTLIE